MVKDVPQSVDGRPLNSVAAMIGVYFEHGGLIVLVDIPEGAIVAGINGDVGVAIPPGADGLRA